MSRRVLVIGEPCVDVIHKADGRVYHEHGGISYSVAAGGFDSDGIETVPIIGLSRDDRGYFEELFRKLEGVNLEGIYETTTPVQKVDLFYENENTRWECSTRPVEPTPFSRINPFLPADGIHVNLISGNDVELKTLAAIRSAAPDAHIHLDLHNAVMRSLPDGKRVRGPMTGYLEWCSFADTVQMNEDEAGVIDPSVTNNDALAVRILDAGPRALIISYAERGLTVFEKSGANPAKHFFPPRSTNVVDPTGSGDVFGGVFLHAIVSGKSLLEAVEQGIETALLKVAAAGPEGFIKNRKSVKHV